MCGIMCHYQKRSIQLQCKKVVFLLFVAMVTVPTEQSTELKVLQVSPNSSFVALGQPLKLNVTVNNVTQPRYYRLYIYWSFRRFSSTPFEELAKALWHVDQDKVSTDSHDSRASIVDNATLELVNTTLHDSGTYQCLITSYENKYSTTRYLYFNVTIEDEPKAEITCSQNTKLTEGENFFCWCNAVGVNMVPTASWVRGGHLIGNASSPGTRLILHNVSKDAAGTYICRAQLYTLTDERTTEIIVHYRPRISFFEKRTFENRLLRLTCLADGFPQPSYTLLTSNGTELAQINNGVVIISNYSSTLNESYTCIAKNKFGEDERRLKIDLDSYAPVKKQPKERKRNINGIKWQIPVISVIVGVLVGVGLVCGFQCIRRKNAMATQLTTQNTADSTIYSEPSTLVTSQQGNPLIAREPGSSSNAVPLMDHSSSDYQELNTVRENEENTYQSLNLTTRMKQVASRQR